jgi:hypothetical protein
MHACTCMPVRPFEGKEGHRSACGLCAPAPEASPRHVLAAATAAAHQRVRGARRHGEAHEAAQRCQVRDDAADVVSQVCGTADCRQRQRGQQRRVGALEVLLDVGVPACRWNAVGVGVMQQGVRHLLAACSGAGAGSR